MPLSRVAAYLGIPLTTAKWRLRHARDLLRRTLAPHEDILCERTNE
jgi:DNA-directed RNA polymerase specialized sigma24 family protein